MTKLVGHPGLSMYTENTANAHKNVGGDNGTQTNYCPDFMDYIHGGFSVLARTISLADTDEMVSW